MVNRFRQLDPNLYISASPTCVLEPRTLHMIQHSALDALFVQFFGPDNACSLTKLDLESWLRKVAPGNRNKTISTKLFVGLPASELVNAESFMSPDAVKNLSRKLQDSERWGGISLWDLGVADDKKIDDKAYQRHVREALDSLSASPSPEEEQEREEVGIKVGEESGPVPSSLPPIPSTAEKSYPIPPANSTKEGKEKDKDEEYDYEEYKDEEGKGDDNDGRKSGNSDLLASIIEKLSSTLPTDLPEEQEQQEGKKDRGKNVTTPSNLNPPASMAEKSGFISPTDPPEKQEEADEEKAEQDNDAEPSNLQPLALAPQRIGSTLASLPEEEVHVKEKDGENSGNGLSRIDPLSTAKNMGSVPHTDPPEETDDEKKHDESGTGPRNREPLASAAENSGYIPAVDLPKAQEQKDEKNGEVNKGPELSNLNRIASTAGKSDVVAPAPVSEDPDRRPPRETLSALASVSTKSPPSSVGSVHTPAGYANTSASLHADMSFSEPPSPESPVDMPAESSNMPASWHAAPDLSERPSSEKPVDKSVGLPGTLVASDATASEFETMESSCSSTCRAGSPFQSMPNMFSMDGSVVTESRPTHVSSTPTWSDSAVASPSAKPSASVEPRVSAVSATPSVAMTTRTIYTTVIRTIDHCRPEAIGCYKGQVTTETISVSMTVCPVMPTAHAEGPDSARTSPPETLATGTAQASATDAGQVSGKTPSTTSCFPGDRQCTRESIMNKNESWAPMESPKGDESTETALALDVEIDGALLGRPTDGAVLRRPTDGTLKGHSVGSPLRHPTDGALPRPLTDGTMLRHPADGTLQGHASDGALPSPPTDGTALRPPTDGPLQGHPKPDQECNGPGCPVQGRVGPARTAKAPGDDGPAASVSVERPSPPDARRPSAAAAGAPDGAPDAPAPLGEAPQGAAPGLAVRLAGLAAALALQLLVP